MYTTRSYLIQSPDDQSRDSTITAVIYAWKCFSEQIRFRRFGRHQDQECFDFVHQVLHWPSAMTHWAPANVQSSLCFVLLIIMNKKMSRLFLRSSLHFLQSSAAIIVDKMYHSSGAH